MEPDDPAVSAPEVPGIAQITGVTALSTLLYLAILGGFGTISAGPLAPVFISRGVAGLVLVYGYTPFFVTVGASLMATLSGHRLAPFLGMLTLAPFRVAVLMLSGMVWHAALLFSLPLMLAEFIGVASAIGIAQVVTVPVFDAGVRREMGLTFATVTAAVFTVLAGAQALYFVAEAAGFFAEASLQTLAAVTISVGIVLALVMVPVGVGAARLRFGGFTAAWLGAIVGSSAYASAYFGVRLVWPAPVSDWPTAVALSVVVVGTLAVPSGLLGHALGRVYDDR